LLISPQGNVTFFSYHVHVLFADHEGSPSKAAALALLASFSKTFNISEKYDPKKCDDSETTHGVSPPLCIVDSDYKPYGHQWCPFPIAEWAAFVPADQFQRVVPWVMQHRSVSNTYRLYILFSCLPQLRSD
jgi:hypothetical protein